MTYFKRKIKIFLENRLKNLSDHQADRLANFCNAQKSRLARFWYAVPLGRQASRVLDFIVVRSNGNRFIEFELSNICNARCIFCPYPDMLRTEKKFQHMSQNTLENAKNLLSNFKGALVSFTPTTGDTLLHPNWSAYIAQVLKLEQISRATMFTNAIELDKEASEKLIDLLKGDKKGKFSQIYFSLGGYDREGYKRLYQVDRFDKVRANLNYLLSRLKVERLSLGVHFHIKLEKEADIDINRAMSLYNQADYPFVYISHSKAYFSNDAYTRNALIDYLEQVQTDKHLSCAYLNKTRFAADGGIWADGCVISEMPGDFSLKLGDSLEEWNTIQTKRAELIENWEQKGQIPKPCQGCTMYRSRK